MARREGAAQVARRLGRGLAPWNLCLAAGVAGTAVFYLLDRPWQLVWGNVVAGGAVLAIVAGLWWRRRCRGCCCSPRCSASPAVTWCGPSTSRSP